MREGKTMKKKYAAMILALPALTILALVCAMLYLGFEVKNLSDYLWIMPLIFVCHTIIGIPAIVWLFFGLAGYTAGAWLLLTSVQRYDGVTQGDIVYLTVLREYASVTVP